MNRYNFLPKASIMNFFNILEYGDIEEASVDVPDGIEASSNENVLILYVWWHM